MIEIQDLEIIEVSRDFNSVTIHANDGEIYTIADCDDEINEMLKDEAMRNVSSSDYKYEEDYENAIEVYIKDYKDDFDVYSFANDNRSRWKNADE